MMVTALCTTLLWLLAGSVQTTEKDELQNFAFVIGEWEGTFHLHPTSIDATPVETHAEMMSRWGPQKSWIETDSSMRLPPMGLYAVKVLVRFDTSQFKLIPGY